MLPTSYCPDCGYKLDAATDMKGNDLKPLSGDVSICTNCTAFLQFDDNLQLIPLPSTKNLPRTIANSLFEARRAIHEIQRERQRKQRKTERNKEK